jgi:hypothetical protein
MAKLYSELFKMRAKIHFMLVEITTLLYIL